MAFGSGLWINDDVAKPVSGKGECTVPVCATSVVAVRLHPPCPGAVIHPWVTTDFLITLIKGDPMKKLISIFSVSLVLILSFGMNAEAQPAKK